MHRITLDNIGGPVHTDWQKRLPRTDDWFKPQVWCSRIWECLTRCFLKYKICGLMFELCWYLLMLVSPRSVFCWISASTIPKCLTLSMWQNPSPGWWPTLRVSCPSSCPNKPVRSACKARGQCTGPMRSTFRTSLKQTRLFVRFFFWTIRCSILHPTRLPSIPNTHYPNHAL